jgi:CHAD domain-containing protein
MAVETVTESERKYEAPAGVGFPDPAHLVGTAGVVRVGPVRTHELTATYFDTDDLRLARRHITLRRRTGGTDAGWHLKTPATGGDRTEHRMPLGEGTDVPEELLARVRAVVRDRPVRPVARLCTQRQEHPLEDSGGRVLALLVDDRVHAEAGGPEQRWHEIEVELVEGDAEVLPSLDERLRAAGAVPARAASKLARALGDRLSEAAGPHGTRDADGHPLPGRAIRAVVDYVRAQRDALGDNDPGARAGDADAVHDMRVATWRLRSALRTFRGRLWNREQTEALRAELSWLADQLGGVRDGQVMAQRLDAAVAEQPAELVVGPVYSRIHGDLDAEIRHARRDLDAALNSGRYFRLLDEVDRLVDTPPASEVRGRWVRRKVAAAVRRADALLDAATPPDAAAAAGAGAGGPDRDTGLHEARKAYKRARYAVEVLAPGAARPALQLVERLKQLQDVLGDRQDSVITRQLLRELAARADEAGDSAFTYGVLYADQRAAAGMLDANLPAASRAARRPKLRRWLP